MQGLKNLRVLNVVGTSVTATGLVQLRNLQSLKSMYVYDTKVDAATWSALQKAFPKAQVDTGGYNVPTLVTDTMEVKPAKKPKP